ncbi:MAG: tyrosine-type recombinase/integrase [Alteromonadaceae bacterium]|nr:tyrosine-type recombinase/integrase [Alteromonadaceae bacterium]
MTKIQKNPAEVFICSLTTQVSVRNTKSTLNTIAKFMGFESIKTYPWHEVNYVHLIELKRHLIDRGLMPNSINTYLTVFKGVVREAWRLGIIDIDTYMKVKDVKRLKGNSSVKGQALTAPEVNKLVNYKNRTDKIREIRDSAMIAVLYGAGLRNSELLNLDLSDYIDEDKKIIVKGKGGFIRFMFLPEFSIKALNKWIDKRGYFEGALFSRMIIGNIITEHRLSAGTISLIIERRCEQTGIKRITPHDLRRSYATNLISSGVDIFTVQKLMRHAGIETTRRYDMRGEEVKKAAVDMLPF